MNSSSNRQYRTGQCYKAALMVTGAMCAGLGVSVLLAIATGRVTLARVLPDSVPMPPAAAAGFFACGAGLIGIGLWFPVAASMLAMITVGIGLAAASGTLMGLDPSVWALLQTNFVPVSAYRPLAPNTIACFLLAGTALALRGFRRLRGYTVVAVLGSVVLAIGLTAAYGYMTGLPLFVWLPGRPMSFLSTIACSLLGLGVVITSWRYSEIGETGAPVWFPTALGAGAVAVNICLAVPLLLAGPAAGFSRWGASVAVLLPSFGISMLIVGMSRKDQNEAALRAREPADAASRRDAIGLEP